MVLGGLINLALAILANRLVVGIAVINLGEHPGGTVAGYGLKVGQGGDIPLMVL